MPLNPSEAADALRDIARTERRSSSAYGYRLASPHLILWGVVWAAGYGAMSVDPKWSVFWPALSLAGVAGSFLIGWRMRSAGNAAFEWRYAATLVAVFVFIAAIFAIMPPKNDLQISAFFPLLTALLYALVGIWTRGLRMLVAGFAIAALTVAGYFCFPTHFLPWMAVVGGGGLILGGIWLRSV